MSSGQQDREFFLNLKIVAYISVISTCHSVSRLLRTVHIFIMMRRVFLSNIDHKFLWVIAG